MRNSKMLSDLVSGFSHRILSNVAEVHGEELSSHGDATAALAEGVSRLRMKLRQALAAAYRPLIVVDFGGQSLSGAKFGSLLLSAAVIGVAGYGFLRWRGWRRWRGQGRGRRSLPNIMDVSERNVNNTSRNASASTSEREFMNRNLEGIDTAVANASHQLPELMNRSLEGNTAATNASHSQAGAVRRELAELEELGSELRDLLRKIDEVAEKQKHNYRGVLLLCRMVHELQGGRIPDGTVSNHTTSSYRPFRTLSAQFLHETVSNHTTSSSRPSGTFSAQLLQEIRSYIELSATLYNRSAGGGDTGSNLL